jgi:hypothetical protein
MIQQYVLWSNRCYLSNQRIDLSHVILGAIAARVSALVNQTVS